MARSSSARTTALMPLTSSEMSSLPTAVTTPCTHSPTRGENTVSVALTSSMTCGTYGSTAGASRTAALAPEYASTTPPSCGLYRISRPSSLPATAAEASLSSAGWSDTSRLASTRLKCIATCAAERVRPARPPTPPSPSSAGALPKRAVWRTARPHSRAGASPAAARAAAHPPPRLPPRPAPRPVRCASRAKGHRGGGGVQGGRKGPAPERAPARALAPPAAAGRRRPG